MAVQIVVASVISDGPHGIPYELAVYIVDGADNWRQANEVVEARGEVRYTLGVGFPHCGDTVEEVKDWVEGKTSPGLVYERLEVIHV